MIYPNPNFGQNSTLDKEYLSLESCYGTKRQHHEIRILPVPGTSTGTTGSTGITLL
jgi:hypothetical protein